MSDITTGSFSPLLDLIEEEAYVGEIVSMAYENALVMVHDYHRKQAGGIPALSFLVATRMDIKKDAPLFDEESSVILLRVLDGADAPGGEDYTRIRAENARRVSGEAYHWDSEEVMNPMTNHLLGYSGLKCRVVGTFYADVDENGSPMLTFGSDICNFYPNMGLKVYRPRSVALDKIVNFRKNEDSKNAMVRIGSVRYASSHRPFQGIDVPFRISPRDLLCQKSALFGMTRSGKSNTTKTILRSVFELRWKENGDSGRVGQIVFDVNGEYANENVQDGDNGGVDAIRNLWKLSPIRMRESSRDDIVVYGIQRNKDDTDRKLMLLNFYHEDNLSRGKEIIDEALSESTAQYIKNFRSVVFEDEPCEDKGSETRRKRRLLAYRALLCKAGFEAPKEMRPDLKGLFSQDFIEALRKSGSRYSNAAAIIEKDSRTWYEIASLMQILQAFIADKESHWNAFDEEYVSKSSSGESWADEGLRKILEMFAYPNGPRTIGRIACFHSPDTLSDYVLEIYEDLCRGKLIIVDQSSGTPSLNKASADRIIECIFQCNQSSFRKGETPPEILVYIEEAHNVLPSSREHDLLDYWVRTAKEGAKFRIGLVYATQEPSSIQTNILKATANWFVGHLNNTDETREIRKFTGFEDFEKSILRTSDKGFMRVKTLTNPYIVPVQIDKFSIGAGE